MATMSIYTYSPLKFALYFLYMATLGIYTYSLISLLKFALYFFSIATLGIYTYPLKIRVIFFVYSDFRYLYLESLKIRVIFFVGLRGLKFVPYELCVTICRKIVPLIFFLK